MTRVLLVDDHTAFVESLAQVMRGEDGITVSGQATTLAQARKMLDNVDVGIFDLSLPDGSGVELITELQERNPESGVLVLTGTGDKREMARAVVAGAAGCLEKTASLAEIVAAVRTIAEGDLLMTPQEVRRLFMLAHTDDEEQRDAERLLGRLTDREREVLRELCEGRGDKEIAERLHVTHKTVRTHVVNVLGKLEVHSRVQAVIFAFRHGVVG